MHNHKEHTHHHEHNLQRESTRKILIAFLLNLLFSIFEFIGGMLTGSVSISSDAVHDLGDAISIGMSYALEKRSAQKPDKHFTFGYGRLSVLGGFLANAILMAGSIVVIITSIQRFRNPVEIQSTGMLICAVIGVVVNTIATFITHGGKSVNQKAVSLHMLEDVLGWIVVLIGGAIIKVTGWTIIDPILSFAIACFILFKATGGLIETVNIFLEKAPDGTKVEKIEKELSRIQNVKEIKQLRIWTIDGQTNIATAKIVCSGNVEKAMKKIRQTFEKHEICDVTVEIMLPEGESV